MTFDVQFDLDDKSFTLNDTSAAAAEAAAERAESAAETLSGSVAQIATNTQDISSLKEDISHIGGLSDGIKSALLACFQNVVWNDTDGQTYYDALYAALYPPANLVSISCVYTQSGTVYDTDSLDTLKTGLVVTAHFDDSSTQTVTTYTLSGLLEVGTSTITVVYGGQTTSFSVTVTEKPKAWYTGVPLTLGTISAGSISNTTGAETESDNWSRTVDYFDIEGAHLIQFRLVSDKRSTGNSTIFYFYDADYDFISSKGFNSSNNKFTIATIPTGTKYVRVSAANACLGEEATTPLEVVPYATPTESAAASTSVTSSTVGYNINTTTGNQGTSGSTRSTQLISIYGAQSLAVTKDSDSSAWSFGNVAFYDKDGNYMGFVQSFRLSDWNGAIPYNQCAYIRFYNVFTNSLSFTVTTTTA